MGQNLMDNDEVEIDLLELFFELMKHWKSIVLATVLAGAIGYAFSVFFITPTYESTSELYVLSKSTSITSLTDLQTGTNLTNDYMVVVTGRPVLEQVIRNLNLDEDYESFYRKIALENPSNSRILKITVTDTDPSRAKEIADEMADVAAAFISEKMDQDPPSIIQYGYSDNNPVAPSKFKNAVIAALVGMMLSMGIIILTYLFNDTIITPEDVEKKLGLNVLGTLPLEEEVEFDGKSSSKRGA